MFRIYLALLLLFPLAAFSQIEIGPHGMFFGKSYDATLKALYNTGNKQLGIWGQQVAFPSGDQQYVYRSAGVLVNFLRMDDEDRLGFYNSVGLGVAQTANAGYGALVFGKFGARVGIARRVFICAEAGVQMRTVPWDEGQIKPLFELPVVSLGVNYRFGKKANVEVAEP